MNRLCMGCIEEYDDMFEICPHCGYVHGTPAKEAYHIVPGAKLANRYIVGRVLGFGGFGITYIGYDTLLKYKVAIKEYMPSEFSTRMPNQQCVTIYTGDREEQYLEGLKKVIDEAKRLAQFQSEPGIVHIYDCFEENNTAYIVMEYLDGESLKEKLLRDGKMTVEEALPIVLAVVTALKKVHQAGIIHRDIAPDNIYLLKNGEVKLLDFGAARYATTKHSKSLSVIIKQGYAPEEQYRSRGDQGAWTDIYSLAATFYKMLTGVTPEDAMERSIKDDVKKPSKLGVKIEKSTETAIMNAMNIKIHERTQSAEDFERELLAAEVKEIQVKKEREDMGKIPLWSKIAAGLAGTAIVVFMILLATGTIRFDIAGAAGIFIPDGQTRVPNVVNSDRKPAEEKLDKANLSMQISGWKNSDEVPANKILVQDVKAGSLVDTGGVVSVMLSSGEETSRVPNVVGLTREEAAQLMEQANLIPKFKEMEWKAAPGTIAAQDKEAETLVTVGSTVELTVSMGLGEGDVSKIVEVADVVGMDYDAAVELLYQNYLYLQKTDSQYSDTIPAGQIISQTPGKGDMVSQESNVSVTVSLGREMVYVPQVTFTSLDEARGKLEALGLITEVLEEYSSDVPVGNITRQSIEAETSAEKGSTVTVYVSLGKEPEAAKPASQNETRAARQTQPQQAQPQQAQPQPQQTQPPQTQPPETQPPETQPPQTQPPETQPAGDSGSIWDIIGD